MKVLVLGVYYDCNLGDAVICECVADRIRQYFQDAEIDICDLQNRHEYPIQQKIPMNVILKRRKRRILREFATKYIHWDKQLLNENQKLEKNIDYIKEICSRPYDIVVFAGGQVFMDAFSLFLETYVQEFSEKKIPILFNACGVGPTFSKQIRERLSSTLLNPYVKLVSTRENVKLVNQFYLQGRKKAVETYDPALWTSEVYGIKKDMHSDTIGLGMMFVFNENLKAMVKFWIDLIRLLEKRNIKWKIFVNGDISDVTFAENVLDNIPELPFSKEAYFAPIPRNAKELVQTIASFKSLISFRLHSHIIACSLDIPTVAMVWDDKLHSFFEKIGHSERCKTVYEKTASIMDALALAELEGYDKEIIEKQKKYADDILINSIRDNVKNIR